MLKGFPYKVSIPLPFGKKPEDYIRKIGMDILKRGLALKEPKIDYDFVIGTVTNIHDVIPNGTNQMEFNFVFLDFSNGLPIMGGLKDRIYKRGQDDVTKKLQPKIDHYALRLVRLDQAVKDGKLSSWAKLSKLKKLIEDEIQYLSKKENHDSNIRK